MGDEEDQRRREEQKAAYIHWHRTNSLTAAERKRQRSEVEQHFLNRGGGDALATVSALPSPRTAMAQLKRQREEYNKLVLAQQGDIAFTGGSEEKMQEVKTKLVAWHPTQNIIAFASEPEAPKAHSAAPAKQKHLRMVSF